MHVCVEGVRSYGYGVRACEGACVCVKGVRVYVCVCEGCESV